MAVKFPLDSGFANPHIRPMTYDQLLHLIRRGIAKAGSQKAYAGKLGVSTAYLNDVLHGRRDPGEAILRPLGLERHITTYRKVTP